MLNVLAYALLPLLLVTGVCTSYQHLKEMEETIASNPIYENSETALFPDGNALKAVAFGYNNFLSNILWFKTISYFGKHYQGDRNYKWLGHMCTIVFALDSRARHVPEFCALMLAWEANDPAAALQFLDTAVEREPDYWRYYYLRGISNVLFRKDAELAKNDFYTGSRTPNAPVFMARLATKTLANLENPQMAISFLKDMVRRASDPHEKASLERHLRQTIHDTNIVELEQLVAQYNETHTTALTSLNTLGRSEQQLADPYGGTYYWSTTDKKVLSTSGVPRGKILTGLPANMKKP